MELIISVCLGIWIALSGVICYLYMDRDDKRGGKR